MMTYRVNSVGGAAGFAPLAPGRREKGAYLGLSCSPVSPSLRSQLKLENGVGLVVDFVEKGSPAEAAGFKQYDVLRKLDDQILIDPHQLAVLVRMHKPADQIKFDCVREGQATPLSAKLTEKELPPLEEPFVVNFSTEGPGAWAGPMPAMQGVAAGGGMMAQAGMLRNERHAIFVDSKYMMVLSGDPSHLVVTDTNTNKVVFDGSAANDETLKSVPEELRPKIKAMLEQGGMGEFGPMSIPATMPDHR